MRTAESFLPEGAEFFEGRGRVKGKWKVIYNGKLTYDGWCDTKEEALEQFKSQCKIARQYAFEREIFDKRCEIIRNGGEIDLEALGADHVCGMSSMAELIKNIFGCSYAEAKRFVSAKGEFERSSKNGFSLYNTEMTLKKAQENFV